MGRKSVITDKRARRYIRILDEDKWAEIDKLLTIKKYGNSFKYGMSERSCLEFILQ